jgi:hypothetical protein
MSAPKVKSFDAVSTVLGFLLASCSEKATGNRKKAASPQETGLQSAPTYSKGCGMRGAVSRFQSLQ